MDLHMLKLDKLDISDVRKSLFEIRERYKNNDSEPIYLCQKLSSSLQIEQFCWRFAMSSHLRRHQKSNTYKSRQKKDSLCESDPPQSPRAHT